MSEPLVLDTFARTSDDDCRRIDDLAEPYVDGELDETEHARVERHLKSCGTCRARVELARDIQHGLRALPTLVCPAEVTASVIEATEGASPASARVLHGPWWRRPTAVRAAMLAAAAILAVTIASSFRTERLPTPPPVSTHQAEAVAQAEADVKLALAYLGRIGERTGTIVREDVLEQRVATPVLRSVRRALTPNEES